MSEEISSAPGKDFVHSPTDGIERSYGISGIIASVPSTSSGKSLPIASLGKLESNVNLALVRQCVKKERQMLICVADPAQSLQSESAATASFSRALTPPSSTPITGVASTEDGGNIVRTPSTSQRDGQSSSATLGAAEQPRKKRSLLKVPSRSSSHTKLQSSPTSTALTGATASDPAGSIGRGSKGSMSERRQAGSVASSQRSQQAQGVSAEPIGQVKSGAETNSASMPKTKRRGLSRFLFILNCCGVPHNATTVDTETPSRPVKQNTLVQAAQGRQAASATKQDASAAESSTAESKDPIEEKISGAPYSETMRPAAETKVVDSAGAENTMEEKPKLNVEREEVLASRKDNIDEGTTFRDSPLPSLPDSANREYTTDGGNEGPSRPSDVQVLVQAPTPVVGQHEEEVISDRTPQQAKRDSDVEMADTPLPVPMVDEPAGAPDTFRDGSGVDLPPPPPLAETVPPPAPTQATSALASPNEKQQWLLPPIQPRFHGKKCLVLDLDETLVHSSFKILHQADFTIPVEIEGQYHNVYVIKRPGVDQFMKRVGELYEVVVFTASVSKYGDPLLDQLDIHQVVHHRLFRESCYNHQGNYVKDLSQVGRDLRETIIIDNSPTSYIFHPQHAVPISSWFSDAHDNELLDLIPVLEDLAGSQVRDVSLVLDVAL
ncbi:MAG: hypothetical protein M1830_003597 [Pleopsidium flavum]|nr:MAG: hypothetical protein M1830_003597 [Pleopsidium flavum]